MILAGVLAATAIRTASAQVPANPTIREVTDDDVDRAIQRTIRYIYGRQTPTGAWPDYWSNVPAGGPTAISVFALLDAGEDANIPAVKKGIGALIAMKTTHSYVRALRFMAMAQAGGRNYKGDDKNAFIKCFLEDKAYFLTNAAAAGAWGYGGPDRTGDNSASQFALLALWEAQRAGEDLPAEVVRKVEATWIARQKKADQIGGWTYAGTVGTQGDATCSMTAAGLASMYICQDLIEIGAACQPYANKKVIDDAMAWMIEAIKRGTAAGPGATGAKAKDNELRPDFVKNGYLAFCLQRVGLASGLKFIGPMDWFAVGARELVKPQPFGPNYQGQWGVDVDAAFQLLFLSRGRVPLVFNKVDLGAGTGWDTHPRDIAQFAEYMRRKFEEKMRWQVVKISDDLRMLLDAPILLIAATKDPQFDDATWAKLREYSLRGGILLFIPVHGAPAFTDAIKAKLGTLYTDQQKECPKHYAFGPVAGGDEIYNALERMKDPEKALPMFGVNDGTRWLAILCPTDVACTWQRLHAKLQPVHYQLAMNMYTYATGKNALASRMRPVFVGSDQPTRGTVKVGWVRHDGNWNTQPFALDYLSQKLAAENRLAIELTRGVDVEKDNLSAFKLLWITGSDEAKFTAGQVAALRRYIDGNGTVFVNAIGGSPEFTKSVDGLIKRLGAGRAGLTVIPAADSPLMTGKLGEQRGLPLDKLVRVRTWMAKMPASQVAGPLETYTEGGEPRVIFARYGIHDTLDGHTGWGGLSYMPGSAGQAAANVVLYAVMDRPKPPPASQPEGPATQPATTQGN